MSKSKLRMKGERVKNESVIGEIDRGEDKEENEGVVEVVNVSLDEKEEQRVEREGNVLVQEGKKEGVEKECREKKEEEKCTFVINGRFAGVTCDDGIEMRNSID
jgi:hypothetical protein